MCVCYTIRSSLYHVKVVRRRNDRILSLARNVLDIDTLMVSMSVHFIFWLHNKIMIRIFNAHSRKLGKNCYYQHVKHFSWYYPNLYDIFLSLEYGKYEWNNKINRSIPKKIYMYIIQLPKMLKMTWNYFSTHSQRFLLIYI